MKTRTSRKMLLIFSLSALLTNPAFAAFGDDTAAPSSLSDNGAAGSALPPGTYPSSPSDSDKKQTDTDKQPAKTPKPAAHPKPADHKHSKQTPRTGS